MTSTVIHTSKMLRHPIFYIGAGRSLSLQLVPRMVSPTPALLQILNKRSYSQYIPRRAMMYVPGSDERKLLKIPTLKADCVVMDCEDGVAINRKDDARSLIQRMLSEIDFGYTEPAVRINSVISGLAEEDMRAILKGGKLPSAIMLPKVEEPEDIDWFASKLQKIVGNKLDEKLRLVIFIESAMGVINIIDICKQAKKLSAQLPFRLDGLVFGSDDYCADIDVDSLRRQCLQGLGMGYTGKQVIHPAQIETVQECFTPSQEKIKWATEVIKAFDQHQESGKGAFTFQGGMIDMPLLLQAKNIVQIVETINASLKKK